MKNILKSVKARQWGASHRGPLAALSFAGLLISLSACAPQLATVEVNAMLAKGSVDVKADTTKTAVHVATKGEQVGTNVMNGGGGLAGALIGAAIVAASAESDITGIESATQPIADALARKFPRPDASAPKFYEILISGGPVLKPASDGNFQLSYFIHMRVNDIKDRQLLLTNDCTQSDPAAMPLDQWRASVPLIQEMRTRVIASCTAQFASTLGR